MRDQEFEKKWQELQQYVPFLQRIINNLKRTMKDRPRPVQLEKMEMLHDLLTKRDKSKLKFETLIKCETLLNKIYNKVEQQPPKPVVIVTDVVEILEPDSPPSSNEITKTFYPIEIPTERKKSPEPKSNKSHSSTGKEVVISNELSLEELLKQRELLENKIFNCNQSSNSNSSNDIFLINEKSEVNPENKSNNIKHDLFDIESLGNSTIHKLNSKSEFSLSSTSTIPGTSRREDKRELRKSQHSRWDSSKDSHKCTATSNELSSQHNLSFYNENLERKKVVNKSDEQSRSFQNNKQKFNISEICKIKSDTMTSNLSTYQTPNRSSTPDWDAEFEEEQRLVKEKNNSTKSLESTRVQDSPVIVTLTSNSRERSIEKDRNRNRFYNKFSDKSKEKYICKDTKKDKEEDGYKKSRFNLVKSDNNIRYNSKLKLSVSDHNLQKIKNDTSSVIKLSPSPSLSRVDKYFDEIERADSRSLSPIESSIRSVSRLSDKFEGKDLQIQIQNKKYYKPKNNKNVEERSTKGDPISISSPLVKDVLKSPPLSANDIDDLLHEAGTDSDDNKEALIKDTSNLHEVRKKLAKISTKQIQNSNSMEDKNKDFYVKSPDVEFNKSQSVQTAPFVNDRLALKYHPHIKKSSINIESNFPLSSHEKICKTLRATSNSSIINTFPTIKVNDPRLKNKSQEVLTNMHETFPISNRDSNKPYTASINFGTNSLQNIGKPIPSLLSKIIPSPLDNIVQSNIKKGFPSNLIEIPLQVNIPLIGPAIQATAFQQQAQVQKIPLVTIPKSTFSDFLNNKNQTLQSSSVSGNNLQVAYNKINPVLNDNFERQKYFESKKTKISEDLFGTPMLKGQNAQPKTYGEYRRQCELDKSKGSTTDINKPNNYMNNSLLQKNKSYDVNSTDLPGNEDDLQNMQTRDSKLPNSSIASRDPRQIIRRRDSLSTRNESEQYSKAMNHETQNEKSSNCINNASRSSNYAANNTGSILKFKIPKRNKDENDVSKEEKVPVESKNLKCSESCNEKRHLDNFEKQENYFRSTGEESMVTNSGNKNLNFDNSLKEKIEKIDFTDNKVSCLETSHKSSKRKPKLIALKKGEKSTLHKNIPKRRRSMTLDNSNKDTLEFNPQERKINSGKILLRRKSMSATALYKNLNLDISSSKNFNLSTHAFKELNEKSNSEILNVKDDSDSLRSFDTTTDSASISSHQGCVKEKSKRSKRYNNYYYEMAPDSTDNSVLSVENIIEGKRRSRSAANMNENALSSLKSVTKIKSFSVLNTDLTVSNTSETSNDEQLIINHRFKKSNEKELNLQNFDTSCNTSFDTDIATEISSKIHDKTENSSKTIALSNVTESDAVKEICNSSKENPKSSSEIENKSQVNSEMLESLFLKIVDPNAKKENLLGVLSKVCDEKKFEKIKAILEEDDKLDQGRQNYENTSEEFKNKNFDETNIDNFESQNQKIEEMFKHTKEKDGKTTGKKHKTELDRLNEDIRDMFISQGVLAATGKRNQLLSNDNKEESIKNTQQKNQNLKRLSKTSNNENDQTNIFASKTKELKIVLKKLNLNSIESERVILKAKAQPKRKRVCAWARGRITKKKSTSTAATRKQIVKKTQKEIETCVENSICVQTLSEQTKVVDELHGYTKPCPKSKKKTVMKCAFNKESTKLTLEFSLTDLETLKNIYSDMHAKSQYSHKCLLCHKYNNSKNLVLHYVDAHPQHEVLISRLPPDTLKDLCSDRNNSALYQYSIKARNQMLHYRCPFCDIQQTASRSVWLCHFSTHTGEYHYKCSGCGKHSNLKNTLKRHLTTNCINSQLVTKEFPSAKKNNIAAYLCNLCNYVQLLQTNIMKHLAAQHSKKNKNNFRKIKLLNMEKYGIKLEFPPEEETKVIEEENYEEIEEDTNATPVINEGNIANLNDKLEVFIPKEQTDLNLDKNLLSYMNEVSFNVQSPKIIERSSKSIVDELSERLKSQNSKISKQPESQMKRINNEKNVSIVDLLSKRLQNLSEFENSENLNYSKDKNLDEKISNKKNSDVSIHNIGNDKLNNVALSKSTEQVISKNKPISDSYADIDKAGVSSTSQINLSENNDQMIASIYKTLNEKLKNSKLSPDKKTTSKIVSNNLKNSQKMSGITIIDRLNKRLKEATGGAAVINNILPQKNKSDLSLPRTQKKTFSTDVENHGGCDSGDDNLVIDEDYDVGVSEVASNFLENESAKGKNDDEIANAHDDFAVIEDDDDCWEDIEILSPSNDNRESVVKETKKLEKTQHVKDNKNQTILKTLSKLYVSFGKKKQNSKKQTKQSDSKILGLTTRTATTEEICDSNLESNLRSKIVTEQQILPLSDLINDAAIPSPISTELITDPPVPLPSEPLSDLNDISEILEPVPTSAISTFSSFEGLTTGVDAPKGTVHINDIDDPIYDPIPENATISDALALAADIENTSFKNDKGEDQFRKCVNSPVTSTFRINNLGFSEAKGKIKYLCLVHSCSFLFSNHEIGLQNHYLSDHKTIYWDGYCYTCEANICSEDELPLDRELKHMTEVHIKNLIKSQNLHIENSFNQNSDSNKSFEEVLMSNRPKITIRRLSGDLLSKNNLQPSGQVENTTGMIPPLKISFEKRNLSELTGLDNPMTSNVNVNTKLPVTSDINTAVSTVFDGKQKLTDICKQNLSIKDLLIAPSVPPPLLPNITIKEISATKCNSIDNIHRAPQHLQLKAYTKPNNCNKTLTSANIDQISQSCIVLNKPVPTVPLIKNNFNSGSSLKISSVSQGVTVSEKDISPSAAPILKKSNQEQLQTDALANSLTKNASQTSPKIIFTPITQKNQQNPTGPLYHLTLCQNKKQSEKSITSSNISVQKPMHSIQQLKSNPSFLRIENVCSLGVPNNVGQNSSNVTQILHPKKSQSHTPSTLNLSSSGTSKNSASTEKDTPCNIIPINLDGETNSDTVFLSEGTLSSSLMKLIKPWIYPTVAKSVSIAQYQLRSISLYATFKCMNVHCFYATSSSENILEHFKHHENKILLDGRQTIEANSLDWLRCSYCNFTACNSANYVEHINSVHAHDIFQCPYCFYRSCNDFNVLKHIEEYHHDLKIKVLVCIGERKRLASEMKHLAIYRARYIKPISCFDCSKKFFILRNYLRHLQEHNPNSECYTCGMCNSSNLLKKCADTHLSLVHRISVYQCIYCDLSSSLRNIMIAHMAKEHPSHLLYSCVRVSPNKNMIFSTETVENSTVLANLNETVDSQYLQPCNFITEHLNFMNPSLTQQAIEHNKTGRISKSLNLSNFSNNTNLESDVSNIDSQSLPKIASVTSLAVTPQNITNKTSTSESIKNISASSSQLLTKTFASSIASIILAPADVTVDTPIILDSSSIAKNSVTEGNGVKKTVQGVFETENLSLSSSTLVISETITIDDDDSDAEASRNDSQSVNILTSKSIDEILKSCAELTKSVALAQEKQEVNTKLSSESQPKQHIIQHSSPEVEKSLNAEKFGNEEIDAPNSSNTILDLQTTTQESADLNKRIVEAAKEYVVDTGYEGSDLYKCSVPECSNIKLSADTLTMHYSQNHPRLRQFKCPHCTCQYNNIRSLKGHLATHKRHRYFCFLCTHTSSIQPHLTKHMGELHAKSSGLISFPLASQLDVDNEKANKIEGPFFVVAPAGTKLHDIIQFGDRLVRICERKRSLAKRNFNPSEIDQLPFQAIFNVEVFCSLCSYKTKVRTNMYRHLLFHKTEVKVASIDPVNPVPCLISNEKNFDKMINMALSSNLNKDNEKLSPGSNIVYGSLQQTENKSNNNEVVSDVLKSVKIPEFIPQMRRFICGVPNCNYLTIADYMLKGHLQTLHSEEKDYKCPHCKTDIITKKSPEKILQHLKFHDSKIYVCEECTYMHFLKYVVERHINDRHSQTAHPVNIIQYERKDSDTIITKQRCNRLVGGSASTRNSSFNSNARGSEINTEDNIEKPVNPDNMNGSNTVSTHPLIDEIKWSCTTCKFKTTNEQAMIVHINSVHNIRFRYCCFHCKFGASQINLVKEHITDKHHNFQQRQVKSNYNRLDESDYDIVQENRPLWTRSDPYRIKHIRGILMEDEDEGNKASKSSSDKKSNKSKRSSISNNTIIENNTAVAGGNNKRKCIEKKNFENSLSEKSVNTSNVVILNEGSSSSQDSSSKIAIKNLNSKQTNIQSTKIIQNPLVKTSSSSASNLLEVSSKDTSTDTINSLENCVEIYECYYCPMKNISLKVIYTHWLLHHCKKTNDKIEGNRNNDRNSSSNAAEKSGPLLAKPFAFKVVGYIGANSIEVSTYDITNDQLYRLLKMGQRVTRFQCNKCWRLFANSISVAEHQKNDHSNAGIQNHRCLTFKNRNFFICSSCGYASSLECKTAAHLLNHYEGLKKCSKCNKDFDKFLDFIRHLPVHNLSFKSFIQMDNKVGEFWSKIIILFPNGLCVMRSNIPKDSSIILNDLLDIVNNEVETALMQTAPNMNTLSKFTKEAVTLQSHLSPLNSTLSSTTGNPETNVSQSEVIENLNTDKCKYVSQKEESDMHSTIDNKLNKNMDNRNSDKTNCKDTNKFLIPSRDFQINFKTSISDILSVPSTRNLNQPNLNNQSHNLSLDTKINDNKMNESEKRLSVSKNDLNKKTNKLKPKRKYPKDSDWLPSFSKKKKTSATEDEQNDDDIDSISSSNSEDEEDNLPLLTMLRNTTPIPQLERKVKPFIGPKFTQKKFRNSATPYSYYGNKAYEEDVSNLVVKVKFDDKESIDETITLTYRQYAEIVPIDCYVVVEKLNPNILKYSTVNLLKRKIESSSLLEDSEVNETNSFQKSKKKRM